jgi:hypothetical protein
MEVISKMILKKHWTLSGILFAVALFATPQADAKCTVTLEFTNSGAHAITVLGNDSQARVNGGTWSKMSFHNVTIQPGSTGHTSWTTNMSCGGGAKRDLRFKFQDSGDSNIYEKMVDNVDIDDGLTYGPYVIKND